MKCDECGHVWRDGIDGCPKCGSGNPFKGIECLTPLVRAAEEETQVEEVTE